jgi:hypothetical protein
MLKQILILILIFSSLNSKSQDYRKLILGQWAYKTIEATNLNESYNNLDSINYNLRVTFYSTGKFETIRIDGGESELVGKGSYRLSKSGKELIQDNSSFYIFSLSKNEMILKIGNEKYLRLVKVDQ